MLKALLAAAHEIKRTDNQLFCFEWVIAVVLGFGVTLVIKESKTQVKAAEHFNQPLVLQGFRHHDQDAFSAASQQLLVQNHPGFNGFT